MKQHCGAIVVDDFKLWERNLLVKFQIRGPPSFSNLSFCEGPKLEPHV